MSTCNSALLAALITMPTFESVGTVRPMTTDNRGSSEITDVVLDKPVSVQPMQGTTRHTRWLARPTSLVASGIFLAVLLSFASSEAFARRRRSTPSPSPTLTSSPTPSPSPTPTTTPTPSPSPSPTPTTQAFSNVFIVLEENHGFADVVGNISQMPYLNSLLAQEGLADSYYADTHPSLPNYLWLTSGSSQGLDGIDDCTTLAGGTVAPIDAPNVFRSLINAGITWKAYAEDLDAVGDIAECNVGNYAQRHVPAAYYTDITNSTAQQQHLVPFSQFASDLQSGSLPRYAFITPNLQDDAHDGTLSLADQWLQSNISPLLQTPMFQPGGSGVLIIVFDEGDDNTNGGGQVPWVVVSPLAKAGYQSTTFYQHQSTLRLMMEGLGFASFPGGAATAPDMGEFFIGH
jgi:Phosphoesterase family